MTDPTTMSDEELLVAIAEWETGRAARWAPIELLKGAEHLAARAEYMDDKAAYELIKAQANRRGLRRRSAQRRATAGAVEQIWCDVQAGERLVTARAAGRGRHMARAAEDLRIRLQRGLRGLRIADGEVLRGLFLGPIDGNEETDVENLLLTNIEIPAGPLAGGFAFEHDPRSPDGCACGYDYRPVDPVAPFDLWRAGDVVAGWHAFELQHGLIAPAIWWHARARRGTNPPDGGHPPARLMVRIEVTAPRPLTLEELKAAPTASSPPPSGCRVPPPPTRRSSASGCGPPASPRRPTRSPVCCATRLARPSGRANA